MVVGAAVVGAFQVGKLPASIPVIRADLAISLVTAGWVVSAFQAVGVAAGSMLGALADVIGHRRMAVAGLAACGVASAAGAAADGAAALLVSRVFEGMGAIALWVVGPALLAKAAHGPQQRLAFGFWGSYMPAGAAIMTLATPVLIAEVGWRGLWLVNGVLLAAAALVLFAVAPRDARPDQSLGARLSQFWPNLRRTATAPGPVTLALCFGAYTANYMAVLMFLPTFLIERQGMADDTAALFTALALGINVLGNLTAGWLLRAGVPRWPLVAIAAATMGASTLGIYAPEVDPGLRLVLCLVFSAVGGMLPASVLSAGPVHAPTPAQIGTTNGLIMQGSALGQLLGPVAVTSVVAAAGWGAAPWVTVALSATSVLLALVIGALERRMAPAG